MKFNLKTAARGVLALALAAGFTAAQAQQKVITMKASSVSLNDINHEYFKVFKTGIEAKSNGRIKVDIFPAGQLGPLPRTVEGVTLGTVDLDQPAMGFLVGIDPRFIVFDAPGLFPDQPLAFLAGTLLAFTPLIALLAVSRGTVPRTTSSAPALRYSSLGKPEPAPAWDSTRTRWPRSRLSGRSTASAAAVAALACESSS